MPNSTTTVTSAIWRGAAPRPPEDDSNEDQEDRGADPLRIAHCIGEYGPVATSQRARALFVQSGTSELLPQPGGFEGLNGVEILPHANNPAVCQLCEGRERIRGRGIAGLSTYRRIGEDQQPFA
jgi:hypothetical protein